MSQAIGGQAVLEGVMMRGPRNWAVAVRKPDGDIAHVARDDRPARRRATGRCACRSCAASSRSARASRSASARSSVSANYAAQEEAEGDDEPAEIGRWALAFAFLVAIGFAVMIFKVGPALLADLLPISNGELVRARRGPDPRRACSSSYLTRAQLHPVAAARLPVPRRRAQGDQRVRGGRGADAGDRAALLADPPALRHGVPALGDGRRRLRLRAARPARLVLADRQPHRAAARDRRASPTS